MNIKGQHQGVVQATARPTRQRSALSWDGQTRQSGGDDSVFIRLKRCLSFGRFSGFSRTMSLFWSREKTRYTYWTVAGETKVVESVANVHAHG